MLKGAGCLLLLGAAGAVQLSLMGEHRRELELLAGLEAALERMAETVRLERMPMPRLIQRLSRSGAEVVRPFFACVLAGMKRGESLETAWKAAVEELHPAAQVRELLLELHLDGDEETVVAQLRHAAQGVERCRTEKRRQRREKEKLSASLSFSAAALAILLLI